MNLNLVPNGNKVRLILEIISSDSLSQNDRETKLNFIRQKENQAKRSIKPDDSVILHKTNVTLRKTIESQKKQDH